MGLWPGEPYSAGLVKEPAGFLGKVAFKDLWVLKGEVRKELCVEKAQDRKHRAGEREEGRVRVGRGWGGGGSEYLFLGQRYGQVGSKHMLE